MHLSSFTSFLLSVLIPALPQNLTRYYSPAGSLSSLSQRHVLGWVALNPEFIVILPIGLRKWTQIIENLTMLSCGGSESGTPMPPWLMCLLLATANNDKAFLSKDT